MTTASDQERSAPPSSGLEPEELGRPVPGKGEAIEPEATHGTANAALRTAERMWGPPGTLEPEKPKPSGS